ncbi:hypothetical protein BV210_00170 [Halorientalis sp. IM1011]|uniref:tyrosine-type recombinase/integrase n=1 Tax=Halorientalis sp. IM1011 TaxID=1932360 RepID=UPI00097CCB15|nr:site-specific integrase [Halorientalis sp. IM1011]AQL41220.1 hypothetical protein BV210_00170 [Halorientalis sp. IM1011]
MTELQPIEPREALEMYCQDIDGDLSPNSLEQKRYQLGFFVDWCEGKDRTSAGRSGDEPPSETEPRIENLNNITGRDFTRFKNWRGEDINKVTLRTNLSALRTFMRFCVKIDAVAPSIPDKVNVPQLANGENERESLLGPERAERILEYLRTFHYASLRHVVFELQWRTGVRMSALHSLDTDDVYSDEQRIELVHRPEEGTRLKNGADGERIVAIDEYTAGMLEDYIDYRRIPRNDDYGREPLLTSSHGRMSKGHLNKQVYRYSAPCEYGADCPAGRDPQECEYAGSFEDFVACPHNVRPHDVRRGSITHYLRNDVPEKAVSDRMNVSLKTLDRHYDKRSDEEKAEQRREYFSE